MALALLAGIALANDAGPDGPESFDLTPNFVAGRTARYDVWTLRRRATTTRMRNRSHSAEILTELKSEVMWSVDRVNGDGSAVCTMTLVYMTADLTLPTGTVQHNDSRRGSGDTTYLHSVIRAMAGAPLRVRVGADGRIARVSGVSVIEAQLGDKRHAPTALDFEESVADLAMLIGASAAMQIGQRWNQKYTWNHPMGLLHHDTRYTLDSVEDIEGIPIANVSAQARVTLEPDQQKWTGGAQMRADMDIRMTSGQVDSQIMFDLQRHEAVGRNTIEQRTIKINVRNKTFSLTNVIEETVHSQALRIAEQ